MTTKAALHSDLAIPPGELLHEESDARGLTQRELASRMRRAPRIISNLVLGRRSIFAELALELEAALDGPSADYWLGLQVEYDLTVARASRSAP
ncbi:HigA family addiction module antidote protein [bacterium]|nr:HigA family addiction module antidote protein [bacterium]